MKHPFAVFVRGIKNAAFDFDSQFSNLELACEVAVDRNGFVVNLKTRDQWTSLECRRIYTSMKARMTIQRIWF